MYLTSDADAAAEAATGTVHVSESGRFRTANRYGGIFAVPERIAGVMNTASAAHRAYRLSPRSITLLPARLVPARALQQPPAPAAADA